MSYKRIAKDGAYLTSSNIGTLLIGLANMAILTRYLKVEDMGRYSLLMMFVNVFLMFAINWQAPAFSRYGREEYVKTKKINNTFWAGFHLVKIPSLVILSFIILFHNSIMDYLKVDMSIILLIIPISIFSGGLILFMAIFKSINHFKRLAISTFSSKFIYFLGLAVLYFWTKESGLLWALLVFNFSYGVVLLINYIFIDKSLFSPKQLNSNYLKKVWHFSWPHLIGLTGVQIIQYIDLIVIKHYLNLEFVAIYAVAYSGFSIICAIMQTINTLFEPLIVEFKTLGRIKEIRRYFYLAIIFSVFYPFVIFLGRIVTPFIFPLIFSVNYIESIPPFIILLFATQFFLINRFMIPLINAFDLVKYYQLNNILTAILNILLDYILIRQSGIMGAAYATLFSFMFSFSITSFIIYKNWDKIMGG